MAQLPLSDEVPLRVATFNLWGIFNSKLREARMKVFATKIQNYDIILLQEQFSPDDFDLIHRSCSREVQDQYYFRRFRSSFYGSGCAVISRYPVKQAFFHTFPLQGYPEMVLHGDFFANKGAAMVRVQVPVPGGENGEPVALQEVILYTTHLVAIYQKVSQLPSWKQERYLPYRISQAISFANLILSTSRPTDRVIIGGDFNCSQRSLEVQMLLILLKKHGYNMRSVLPPPRALLDTAATEAERDQGLRLFTFSNRNPFNTMKTSYFKLLNLEADIPSQIDHIFFSRQAFALRDFSSCPDVEEAYPRRVNGAPNGLVIFTKKCVYVPPQQTFWGSLWYQLMNGRRINTGGKAPTDPQADMYPLSDHYGVAALLGMHIDEVSPLSSPLTVSAAKEAAATPVALTPDEAKVVETVVEFLDSYVSKLRSQILITRIMACTSVLIVTMNLWVLHRLTLREETRAAAMLEQVYDTATATASSAKAARLGLAATPVLDGAKTQLIAAGRWVERHLRLPAFFSGASSAPAAPPPQQQQQQQQQGKAAGAPAAAADEASSAVSTTAANAREGAKQQQQQPQHRVSAEVKERTKAMVAATSDEENRPNFAAMAQTLVLRPLWATTCVSSAVNIIASVTGTAAFAIGMFQRAGNANVLEEQVQQLRLL